MKNILSAALLAMGVLFAAPVMAQDTTTAPACEYTEADARADGTVNGLTGLVHELSGEKLDAFKVKIAEEYGMDISGLTFDLVLAFSINAEEYPEMDGMFWVVLIKDGCAMGGFPEAIDTFEARL